jgi:hypothetical protein
MGRGRIVNALSFFVFLKNVFLNRHSCYYRIDNLNLRFAFLKFVISATIAVTILPNHLWIGRCTKADCVHYLRYLLIFAVIYLVVQGIGVKVIEQYTIRKVEIFFVIGLFACCKIVHIKDQFLPCSSLIACYFCIKTYFNQIRNEIKNFSKYNS